MTYFAGPTIVVEALYGLPAAWVDLTCDVTGLRYNVGRQSGGPDSWLSVVPAGELVLDLNNESGRYSAFSNDGDLVFGEGTVIRVRCVWRNEHHNLFVGQVEEWKENWTGEVDRVVITCVDPLGVLAEQGGQYEWVPGKAGQTPRARIEQLLNRAGVRGEPFVSDQGHITCVSPKLKGTSVLNEIHMTATSDMGVLFHEPHPITDPASTSDPLSRWVYLDRTRFAAVNLTQGALLPSTPVATNDPDWRNVAGPLDRTVGAISRPAQVTVPVFSDACVQTGDSFHGYTDIEWAYIAYERPSLIVVSNAEPVEERDPNGAIKPLPWRQYGAQVPVPSLRHKVVSLTDLRYSTQSQANALAAAIAKQMGAPKLEVTSLRVWPHRDEATFDALLALRLQDHIVTVRNLVHGTVLTRILIDSLVEGVEVTMIPRPGWVNGAHHAEWDVRLMLTPVAVEIEGGTTPGGNPSTGDVYVLADEGQTAGAPALPTGFQGDNLRLSYSTDGDPTTWVYAELENIATGSVLRLDTPVAAEASFDIGGGRWAVTRLFPAATLLRGNAYRVRVVEADQTPADASNYVIVNVPMPTPPKPSVVNQAAWATATYNYYRTTETATSIEWPTVPGVRYQLGIKVGHTPGGPYAEEPVQAGNLWVGSLLNDTDYSVVLRYVSGGTTSPWSEPLKLRMGHPQDVIEAYQMLATSGDINVGPNQDFVATVPLISPPPNGAGDGQWGWNVITFNPNYAGHVNGFIGTIITEMRIRAENYNPARVTEPFGTFLSIPAYGVVTSEVHNGVLKDQVPSNVTNPTWKGSNFTQGYWRKMVNAYVCDVNAEKRNGKFGIRGIGIANASVPIRIRGQVEVWGRTYTARPRLSNKVIP